MSKKILIIFTVILLLVGGLLVACEEEVTDGGDGGVTPPPPTKDEIIFGASRPLTGYNSVWQEVGFWPVFTLWASQINDAGGLYIAEYGKQLPVVYEDYVYDDTSDIGTMTRQLELLMTVDKVDFVLPPASTAFLFAAGPIFNKYEYILLGAEGGATTITEQLPVLPYFFGVLNYSDRYQLPVFADLCVELGIDQVAMIWLQDLHGIEYSGVATTEFGNAGVEVVMSKSVPLDVTDVTLLLQEAEASGADALCIFAYPDQVFLTVLTAIGLGINFDAILCGPGGNLAAFPFVIGPQNAEGIMYEGAWNCNSTPGAQAFCDSLYGTYDPGIADWWGHILYQGGLQFFEQAIEEAGTLDQLAIRNIMATSTFETVLGSTWFDMFGDGGGLLAIECHTGEIGQWQGGMPEVIDPPNQYGDHRTADPIYPKPDWPPPAE